MPLSSGTRLGPYEIQSPLGAGGMGEVYRATDTKLGRDVALKVLPAEMAHDPERLARFRREAKALAQLDHPNIVTIHSVEECDGVHFLTMQLVEGQPLDRLIPTGGLPVEQIVEIAGALDDALAAAHEKGIVIPASTIYSPPLPWPAKPSTAPPTLSGRSTKRICNPGLPPARKKTTFAPESTRSPDRKSTRLNSSHLGI